MAVAQRGDSRIKTSDPVGCQSILMVGAARWAIVNYNLSPMGCSRMAMWQGPEGVSIVS